MTKIYTDGSCLRNPGPGGYAFVVLDREQDQRIVSSAAFGYSHTTNNRMELLAVIAALRSLPLPTNVSIFSDSRYVCDAIQQNWLQGWIAKGWRTTSGNLVKNRDLWQQYLVVAQPHDITMSWVRGHSGDSWNETVDALAREAAQRPTLVDAGFV